MHNQLQVIENKLTSPEVAKKISLALNIPPGDEMGQNRAKKYAYSVFAQVKKTAGDKNGDLTRCNPDSIVQTMIDAAHMQVAIDGRQHAHLIKYGNACTFQMGYRGYLAKIKEHYPDADFVVDPVYEGDTVKIWNENGVQQYRHEKAGAFRAGEKGFIGILFAVTYTDNGRLIQKVADVPRERINRARGAAKQKFVWSSDYIEKAKAAAIKNACKIMFASIQGMQDIVNYDNEKNYNVGNIPATPARNSIIDNINTGVAPEGAKPKPRDNEQASQAQQQENLPPVADDEFIEGEFTQDDAQPENSQRKDDLIKNGGLAAEEGVVKYREWIATLSDPDKDMVRHMHAGWQVKAKKVSSASPPPHDQQHSAPPHNDAPPI